MHRKPFYFKLWFVSSLQLVKYMDFYRETIVAFFIQIAAYDHQVIAQLSETFEPVREKINNFGSNQIQLKPGCTVREDG